ncbi:hypothetical protein DdX_00820 [Ditylenchus destructor]|uniref:Uncharacterized protein n=1 Tax=Ditylenchus destructor TaxID=166010 RepID=A0AAD4NJF7_9BILA|nr:hypothetical protein DdX_00820 [Ditylenchus destructor]
MRENTVFSVLEAANAAWAASSPNSVFCLGNGWVVRPSRPSAAPGARIGSGSAGASFAPLPDLGVYGLSQLSLGGYGPSQFSIRAYGNLCLWASESMGIGVYGLLEAFAVDRNWFSWKPISWAIV